MKKVIIVLLVLGTLGFVAYKYMYKEHRDIASEEAFSTKTATEFISEVSHKGELPSQYINQTIQLSGKVTSSSEHEITLNDKLFFQFDNAISPILIGDSLTIKARCIGYDDLLEEVKFDQSTLIK